MADATQVEQNALTGPHCMESVNRITHLPVVESTIETATSIYEKIKDYNSVTQWTCSTAESAVTKCVDVGKPIAAPIVKGLEGPIKKVDTILCSGLDYVENKVPSVKLPPADIYVNTKEYVDKNVTPKVESAYSYVEPTVKNAYEKIEPAVQTARTVVEPAYEKTKQMVEPYVQPALDKVQALKDNVQQKLEDYISHCSHHHPKEDLECEECRAQANKRTDDKKSQ